jgi:hypothetical protein
MNCELTETGSPDILFTCIFLLQWRSIHSLFAYVFITFFITFVLSFVYFILPFRSRYSSVSMVTSLQAGRLGFDFREGQGFFLFAIASITALGLTQPPIQWVPGPLSLGIKRPGCEADHSPPSSAWSCTSISLTSSWRGA